jgi:hypothetical protein
MAVSILLLGALTACGVSAGGGGISAKDLSQPLNGATTANVDVDSGPGNLTVDGLSSASGTLASGTLQYLDKQGPPTCNPVWSNGRATLTLRAAAAGRGGSGFRWPWQACAGQAYNWHLHLNPTVSYDITAHSSGGNLRLDLAGMSIVRLSASTTGGNVDVALPENAANLEATIKSTGGNVTLDVGNGIAGSNVLTASSRAGNVAIRLPGGVAARIHATSGLGKVVVDSGFSKTGKDTYQSPGYDGATDRIEITAESGAGNVIIRFR